MPDTKTYIELYKQDQDYIGSFEENISSDVTTIPLSERIDAIWQEWTSFPKEQYKNNYPSLFSGAICGAVIQMYGGTIKIRQIIQMQNICQQIEQIGQTEEIGFEETEKENVEEQSFFVIAEKFSRFSPPVQSIYVQKYRSEIQIQTLLSIKEYNYNLMTLLFDEEYDIRKQFPEITFSFSYLPIGIADKKDIVHPKARCIFAQ